MDISQMLYVWYIYLQNCVILKLINIPYMEHMDIWKYSWGFPNFEDNYMGPVWD